VQLRRQAIQRACDDAPLRQPIPRKAEGEIGAVDAAFAQAHAGCGGVARATGVEGLRVGEEQVLAGIG